MSNLRIRNEKLRYYDFYKDYAGKQFRHLLDYYEDGKLRDDKAIVPKGKKEDIYLGSFVTTLTENEDPTYLGYDIYLKWDESPLLNGTVESFISAFGNIGNTEIASRALIIKKFKEQLVRFVKTRAPKTADAPEFLGKDGVKAYYLTKIDGLTNLNDQSDSSKGKAFVDYGAEFMTLTFHEDVTQNLGYLAALYKSLSWSRLNGKQALPENILRFDVDIVVTEARKMVRLYRDVKENKLYSYADQISNYVYTLYECQFFFTDMPHGASIDMSAVKQVDEYSIKFNYKYSTLRFNKLDFKDPMTGDPNNNYTKKIEFGIDNAKRIVYQNNSSSTNNSSAQNGSIAHGFKNVTLMPTEYKDYITGLVVVEGGPSGSLATANKNEENKNKGGESGSTDQIRDQQNSNKKVNVSPIQEEKDKQKRNKKNPLDIFSNPKKDSKFLSSLTKGLDSAVRGVNRGGSRQAAGLSIGNSAAGFFTNFGASQVTKQANLLNKSLQAIGAGAARKTVSKYSNLLGRTLRNIRIR